MICTRYSLKNSKEWIFCISNITSRKIHLFQSFSIKSKSLHISNLLQSIKSKRLIRVRKLQIREIFNNIRSRNRIASNSHLLLKACLKNRSYYYTKYRFFLVYSLQKYRAFCHINCSSFLIVYFVHLFLELFSTISFYVTIVAFATILSNRTMICIVIYELFISIKRFVQILKIFESTIKSAIAIFANSKILDRMTKKQTLFLLFYMYY